MGKAAEDLAEKLSGDLSDSEIAAVIAAHNKELRELESKFDTQKDRQQAELMEKLAQRRLKKEMALREDHSQIVRGFIFFVIGSI